MNAMNPTVRLQLKSTQRRAFTLIELIIVIALTAVLFGLLLTPLISAIRYTQQAQIVTAAQDAARTTRERLTRELGTALFVFDGTSHPFVTANATVAGDDRYTNFLDLEIPGITLANGNYASTIAHAYACKLDFAQPKSVSAPDTKDPKTGNIIPGTPIDPTTQQPISYRQSQNGSAIISDPAYVFPLAAGTTVTRYWVGLKDPSKPYNNTREGKSNGNTDNTYILYRAQFQPYMPKTDPITGNVVTPPSVVPNANLFVVTTKTDANGNQTTIPELDDPDFFRYVKAGDVNWLDDAHAAYTTATAGTHNGLVDKWVQIAKPVIPGPNIDLILLPHNTDNTLVYDKGADGPCTANGCPGFPHSGVAHDPVTGGYYPIVNSSVTFRAGTVSGDATPGTTSDANSQGLPTLDNASGYGYIPTVYTSVGESWALPYHVSLYPSNYDGTQEYYDTQISAVNDTTSAAGTPPLYNAGDLMEYQHANSADTNGKLVYNITRGYPLQDAGSGTYKLGGLDFVPLMVSPDTGTLTFGAPSLPKGPVDKNDRNWTYGLLDTTTPAGLNAGGVDTRVDTAGVLDLTKPVSAPAAATDSPLTNSRLAPTDSNQTGVRNAHITPGGIRVTGPDVTSGPNNGQPVPYTPVNAVADITGNQYYVDYSASTIKFSSETLAFMQPLTSPATLPAGATQQVVVVYDYQANMTLTDPTKPYSFGMTNAATPVADNLYAPMQIKVDYQTRDLIDVSIGVRIYDITNNRAQVIPSETKIKIGNSNRG